jgi:hypothetical protein
VKIWSRDQLEVRCLQIKLRFDTDVKFGAEINIRSDSSGTTFGNNEKSLTSSVASFLNTQNLLNILLAWPLAGRAK